jgi:hypothetical protein
MDEDSISILDFIEYVPADARDLLILPEPTRRTLAFLERERALARACFSDVSGHTFDAAYARMETRWLFGLTREAARALALHVRAADHGEVELITSLN